MCRHIDSQVNKKVLKDIFIFEEAKNDIDAHGDKETDMNYTSTI